MVLGDHLVCCFHHFLLVCFKLLDQVIIQFEGMERVQLMVEAKALVMVVVMVMAHVVVMVFVKHVLLPLFSNILLLTKAFQSMREILR